MKVQASMGVLFHKVYLDQDFFHLTALYTWSAAHSSDLTGFTTMPMWSQQEGEDQSFPGCDLLLPRWPGLVTY